MFKRGLLSAAAAFAVVLGAAGAGQAGVVNWTISNGVFSDGGTLNGTFSIDTSTGNITAYDLISTPGTDAFPNLGAGAPTAFGTEYSPNGANAWFAGAYSGHPEFMEAVYWAPSGDVFQTLLELTSLPVTHGGTYGLAGDESLWGDGEFPILDGSQNQYERTLVSGQAVGVGGVPEPATWAMLILGLGMVGFAVRRRQGLAVPA